MLLPDRITQWLYRRGITDEVIASHNLSWNGTHIVIPIRDLRGNVVFNKYRRDPDVADGPKYTYDAGATAQLYNAHKIIPTTQHEHLYDGDKSECCNADLELKTDGDADWFVCSQCSEPCNTTCPRCRPIIICEGELDALRLESAGYTAVSSTGGAGTFKDEWCELLKDHDLYICYDNDDAGIKGAVKLLTKLPAKLVTIPPLPGIKDITDYMQSGASFPILLEQAEEFPLLAEPVPEFTKIKEVEVYVRKYKTYLQEIVGRIYHARSDGRPHAHLDAIKDLLFVALDNLERKIKKLRYANKPVTPVGDQITQEDVIHAKQVPIDTLYTGRLKLQGGRAVGICPFHPDKDASFTIYVSKNTFWCYGCNAGTDAIDYIKRRDNCDFITAVKTLLNR